MWPNASKWWDIPEQATVRYQSSIVVIKRLRSNKANMFESAIVIVSEIARRKLEQTWANKEAKTVVNLAHVSNVL